MFVSFKHSPQTDSDNIEWYKRIQILNNGSEHREDGFAMVDDIDEAFYRLSPGAITSIARQYNLHYYLGKKGARLPFPAVYSNGAYVLYTLK
jgi:hypothetical protein